MFGPDVVLPARAVLLHIGPHKTGTTAIQGSLRQARASLARHRVVYASEGRVRMRLAALVATGRPGQRGERATDESYWRSLCDTVAGAPEDRVIVSSEFLCDADDEACRKIVADLGGDRVHVVVTLRHLGKILPSSWQQYVRNRARWRYLNWLEATLRGEPFTSPSESFWRRHRHDVLVERWASIVGPHNVVVVVLDDDDHQVPYRAFEHLTDLPTGLLGEGTDYTNRSLTAAEVELVRQINHVAVDADWSDRVYRRVLRRGAVASMQRRPPAPDEPRIATPQWALDRASEIGAASAARIRELGVEVIGDLDRLGAHLTADATVATEVDLIPIDRARDAVVGAIAKSGLLTPKPPKTPKPPPEGDARPVYAVRSGELVAVLARRVARRAFPAKAESAGK